MSDATSDVTWDRLTRACADVAALPGPEREVALRRLSAESPALAEEVRSLLAVDRPMSIDVAGDLGPASPLARGDDAAGLPVDRIGRYRLEARIGRGGSATVYRARTELPPRRVAVKLFDAVAGADELERTASRRFDAEVRALSRLRHPGIATILDAGATSIDGRERRWIAMELVEGPPISTWAREAGPDRETVVRLAADLVAAVAHAHGRGIIHRDLKPANVLVEERDGRPTVRVLDLGVARLLEDEDGDELTRVTRSGQVIGTVGYLAPEQVTGDPQALSVAVDVYAVGLILHEVLGGRPAIDLPTGPLVARLQAVARARPHPIRAVAPDVDEDLAVIVETATAHEPGDRYASAAALEHDLRCRLDGRPIAARPLSSVAHVRRFVARHRAATTAVVVAAVVLPVLLAITAASLAAERRSNERLARSLVSSLDVANAMADAMDRRFGATAFLDEYYRRQLEHVSSLIPEVAAGAALDDPVAVDVVDRHGVEGWRVADEDGRRIARYRDDGGRGSLVRDPGLREAWGDALLRFASVLTQADDLEAALAARLLGLAIERESLVRDPSDPERRREHALAKVYLGDTMHHLGDVDSALVLYERALSVDRALAEERPEVRRHRDDVAWGLDRVANLLRDRDPARARILHRERLAICEGLLAELTPEDGRSWGHALHGRMASALALAMIAEAQGDEPSDPWLERAWADAVRLHEAFPDDEMWAEYALTTTRRVLDRALDTGAPAERVATLAGELVRLCEAQHRRRPEDPRTRRTARSAWIEAGAAAIRVGRWSFPPQAMARAMAYGDPDGASGDRLAALDGWRRMGEALLEHGRAPAPRPGGGPAGRLADGPPRMLLEGLRGGLDAALADVERGVADGTIAADAVVADAVAEARAVRRSLRGRREAGPPASDPASGGLRSGA